MWKMKIATEIRDFQVPKFDILQGKLIQNQISALRENKSTRNLFKMLYLENLLIQQVRICQTIATRKISN